MFFYNYKYYNTTYIYYTLVTYEDGQKEFIKTEGDLEGCVEANADSTYINSKYNCTKCSLGYIPYYNKFFDRVICQNMKAKIKRSYNYSQEMFDQAEEKVNVWVKSPADLFSFGTVILLSTILMFGDFISPL